MRHSWAEKKVKRLYLFMDLRSGNGFWQTTIKEHGHTIATCPIERRNCATRTTPSRLHPLSWDQHLWSARIFSTWHVGRGSPATLALDQHAPVAAVSKVPYMAWFLCPITVGGQPGLMNRQDVPRQMFDQLGRVTRTRDRPVHPSIQLLICRVAQPASNKTHITAYGATNPNESPRRGDT